MIKKILSIFGKKEGKEEKWYTAHNYWTTSDCSKCKYIKRLGSNGPGHPWARCELKPSSRTSSTYVFFNRSEEGVLSGKECPDFKKMKPWPG